MTSSRVLGAVGTGDRWKKYDFIGRRRWWFALSGVILIAGAISLGVKGLNEGIDFTGGSQFDFTTKTALSTGQMTNLVYADHRLGHSGARRGRHPPDRRATRSRTSRCSRTS